MHTSGSEEVNQLSIIVGEGDHRDLYFLNWLILVAKVGEIGESGFKLLEEVLSETGDLGLTTLGVINVSEELVPHAVRDVHLAGVVTSGDGLHVPLDETVLEDTADVINKDHEEQSNEDGDAANVQSFKLSLVLLNLGH